MGDKLVVKTFIRGSVSICISAMVPMLVFSIGTSISPTILYPILKICSVPIIVFVINFMMLNTEKLAYIFITATLFIVLFLMMINVMTNQGITFGEVWIFSFIYYLTSPVEIIINVMLNVIGIVAAVSYFKKNNS